MRGFFSRLRDQGASAPVPAFVLVFVLALVWALTAAGAALAQGSEPPTSPPVGPPPKVTLEILLKESSVEITGVPEGGEVALLTIWREVGGGGTEVTIFDQTLVDQDGDGTVALELDRPYPELSVWLVADVASGAWRALSPESFETRRPEVRPGRFAVAVGQAELDLPRAEVLVIRPESPAGKSGAFRASLGDGADEDGDGEVNGRVALTALELQRPVSRPPQAAEPELPERFQPGDVVLAIDPRTLRVAELEVPGEAPAEPAGGAP